MNERDFVVCSDCEYFKETELIDKRYPELKRGHCRWFDTNVDNRWEAKCEEFISKNNHICEQCSWFFEDEDMIYRCMYYDDEVEWFRPACKNFKLF